MRAPSHPLHPRLNQIRNLHRCPGKVSQRAGALVPIAAGGDDDGLFGVVVLQDDEHAGVAVCLVDVFVEQLQRALDVGGVEAGELLRGEGCAGRGVDARLCRELAGLADGARTTDGSGGRRSL